MLNPRVLIPFILTSLIWGSTWLVITGQLGQVPPVWSVAYRFLIGAAIMFVYALAIGAAMRLDRRGHGFALLFGIPQFCLNFIAVYNAERFITSGLVAVVYALLIVPNGLFAWLFLKHRFTRAFLLGSTIAMAGIALLFVQEFRANPSAGVLAGVALTLGGTLSAAIANNIQATQGIRAYPLPTMLAWGMAYGAGANALIALAIYGPPVFDQRLTYWAGLAYLGVIASALVFSLYFPLVRTIGPSKAAYTSLVIPVIAMLLSTIFEGYVWTPMALAGGLLVFAGLFIALRTSSAGAIVILAIARYRTGA